MAVPNTPYADLEQAILKLNLKGKKLRHRALLAVLLPVFVGLTWLIYSYFEVSSVSSGIILNVRWPSRPVCQGRPGR